MIFDKTGSLAATKRHDYLPFGEELFVGVGGRTPALGYTDDTVRQQFTSKERDVETGLDYFLARYYSSGQGRFTSPDPLLASGEPANPKTWNRYTYVLNNPTRLIDPNGLDDVDSADPEQQKPQQGQVVDLRKDKNIVAEVKKIQETAKPLPEGQTPVLTQVSTVVGETSAIENGGFIDGYGNEVTNFTGVVRPIAYIPLDQNGNIIEGNGVAVIESVKVIRGAKPDTTDDPQPTPKGGVFIDVQALSRGKPVSEIQQAVFVGQFPRTPRSPATTVFRTAVNEITKDAVANTVSVRLGSTRKLR
jgi:RHS repeat-associated protein